MKIFSVKSEGGTIGCYAEREGIVRRINGSVLGALQAHASGRDVGGRAIKLDLGKLLEYPCTSRRGRLTIPLAPPEVWGSGITYELSKKRYSEDDVPKLGNETIYERVYSSPRPELFFKATAGRCVGHGEPIVVRSDSAWTLPEAELGVVLDGDSSILGYTIADDVSARDLESENPLYLPQSKIYRGCCAIGPWIVTPDEIGDVRSLNVELIIERSGQVAFRGSSTTSKMKRSIAEQVAFLFKDNPVPAGSILCTGTGILARRDFFLQEGDVVRMTIERIGTLTTPVVKLH